MVASEGLFQLIHSLSKAEKRFFKLFAYKKKEKLYVDLFDLIGKQKKSLQSGPGWPAGRDPSSSGYDEKAIVAALGLKKKTFSRYKNYLHHLILSRMAFLSSGTEPKLRMLLTQAEFLYNKGLYAQEKKILKKAKEYASRAELNNYLLEILGLESRLAWKDLDVKEANRILKEQKKTIELIDNEYAYNQLARTLMMKFMSTGVEKHIADDSEVKNLMKNPLLTNENKALTFQSRQSLYDILSSFNMSIHNYSKTYLYAKKRVDVFLSEPEKAKHKTIDYLRALHNSIYICSELNKHDEEKQYLDMLSKQSILLSAEHEKVWVFFTFHYSNLNYYIKTGQFQEAIPVVEKLQRELQDYESKLDEWKNIVLYFSMAIVWFGTGQYNKSLRLLNKLRNTEYALHVPPDLNSSLRLFYLVVHFEKGNYSLLPSLAKTTRKDLSSQKYSHVFKNSLLIFFNSQAEVSHSPEALTEQFINLKREFLALKKNQLQDFDYMSWIESKIEKRTYAEIVRQKADPSYGRKETKQKAG